MERKEAVALIADIINLNLCIPSMVAINGNTHGRYDVIVTGECDEQGLKYYLDRKNLALKQNLSLRTIYKP